jgi:Uma2 family endonuclease
MSHAPLNPTQATYYPDSDGKPMADNTRQFEEISSLKWNLEALFADRDDIFVAGDLLWYPLEGSPTVRQAPDALVALGRPKGHRGSYKQWQEDNIAPQVVFEILSPGNRLAEMLRKHDFYQRHGVVEYYVYDPDNLEFTVCLRDLAGQLIPQEGLTSYISPLLGIRFDVPPEQPWTIYCPDGERFKTYVEMVAERNTERERANTERERANAAEARAEKLAAQLRTLGIEEE